MCTPLRPPIYRTRQYALDVRYCSRDAIRWRVKYWLCGLPHRHHDTEGGLRAFEQRREAADMVAPEVDSPLVADVVRRVLDRPGRLVVDLPPTFFGGQVLRGGRVALVRNNYSKGRRTALSCRYPRHS